MALQRNQTWSSEREAGAVTTTLALHRYFTRKTCKSWCNSAESDGKELGGNHCAN